MASFIGYEEMQIMLISDGVTFAHEPENAANVAKKLADKNITVSAINVLGAEASAKSLMQRIASQGKGKYYYLESVTGVDELVFSSVADDITQTIVEEKTPVEINIIKDPSINGILMLPDIYGYIQSSAKSDAKIVLKVRSEKDGEIPVPIYSYRDYGNGRVANFASSFSDGWLDGWSDELKSEIFIKILYENLPDERIDYPFNVETVYDGEKIKVELTPAVLKTDATAALKVITPDGEIIELPLNFQTRNFTAEFKAERNGKYVVQVSYTYLEKVYTSEFVVNVPYSPEYDAFAVFAPSSIYDFIGSAGDIHENGEIAIKYNTDDMAFYKYNYAVPLLIIAVCLFVLDIIVRKMKWSDITALFTKTSKGGI